MDIISIIAKELNITEDQLEKGLAILEEAIKEVAE